MPLKILIAKGLGVVQPAASRDAPWRVSTKWCCGWGLDRRPKADL